MPATADRKNNLGQLGVHSICSCYHMLLKPAYDFPHCFRYRPLRQIRVSKVHNLTMFVARRHWNNCTCSTVNYFHLLYLHAVCLSVSFLCKEWIGYRVCVWRAIAAKVYFWCWCTRLLSACIFEIKEKTPVCQCYAFFSPQCGTVELYTGPPQPDPVETNSCLWVFLNSQPSTLRPQI